MGEAKRRNAAWQDKTLMLMLLFLLVISISAGLRGVSLWWSVGAVFASAGFSIYRSAVDNRWGLSATDTLKAPNWIGAWRKLPFWSPSSAASKR